MWVIAFLWSADTNLCTLFFVWVSQSAGEGPARASNHWSACLHGFFFFFSPSPLFCCFSSHSPAHHLPLSYLLIFHWQVSTRGDGRGKKKGTNFLNPIDLLCQTLHWEFTLVPKSFKNSFFFFPLPLCLPGLFQLEAIFLTSSVWSPHEPQQHVIQVDKRLTIA